MGPQLVSEQLLGDVDNVVVGVGGVDGCVRAVLGDAADDAGNEGGGGADGAEDGVAGALLGSRVALVGVLLIVKGDGDALSAVEDGGAVGDRAPVVVPELEVAECEQPSSPANWNGGVLAGPHGKEESEDGQVGNNSVEGVGVGVAGLGSHVSQELGGDGLLAVGWGIVVVEGFEEGSQGGEEVGAVRLVKGTR